MPKRETKGGKDEWERGKRGHGKRGIVHTCEEMLIKPIAMHEIFNYNVESISLIKFII